MMEYIYERKRATVAELSEVFRVSEATVRRDLKELEEAHRIQRTHGGAIPRERVGFEPSVQEKKDQFAQEKQRIAEKAADLIRDGETILLDSGTTTYQLARLLGRFSRLTVVTNSNHILQELQGMEHLELISTGGMLRRGIESMVGPIAEHTLRMIKVDKTFLGTNALDPEEGISSPHLLEAQVKKAMIRAAKEVILLCDRSKISRVSFAKVAPLSSVDILITDQKAPAEILQRIKEQGVQVIRA
jgi:DeoR family fructose operon transcriptional repressor